MAAEREKAVTEREKASLGGPSHCVTHRVDVEHHSGNSNDAGPERRLEEDAGPHEKAGGVLLAACVGEGNTKLT
jgi:hypothetical protein